MVDFGLPKCSHLGSVRLRFGVWKLTFFCMLFLSCFGRLQVGLKSVQEAPKRPQDPPKSTPGGSKRASRDPKSRSRGLKTLQETPRAPKRQRRLLRSPKSTYPTGLAPNRRKNKGGRAAVIPLGEVIRRPPRRGEVTACQIHDSGRRLSLIHI